jgi:hypothetical protein
VADSLPAGTITFLFTDVEGSTKLLEDIGAARFAEALAEHRQVVREALAEHGGVEVDTQGDAFFCAFSSAPEAVACAGHAQERLEGGPIRVRMGLHTGDALLEPESFPLRDLGEHRGRRRARGLAGDLPLGRHSLPVDGPLPAPRARGRARRLDAAAEHAVVMLDERQQPPPEDVRAALAAAVATSAPDAFAAAVALARAGGYV